MANYSNLKFFDSNGDSLNLLLDPITNIWSGVIHLPEVSTGLYETLSIYMCEEVRGTLGETKFIKPITPSDSYSNDIRISFDGGYDTSPDIFMYDASIDGEEIYVNYVDNVVINRLLNNNVVSNDGTFDVVSSEISNEPVDIKIALKSDIESYHVRTLVISEVNSGVSSRTSGYITSAVDHSNVDNYTNGPNSFIIGVGTNFNLFSIGDHIVILGQSYEISAIIEENGVKIDIIGELSIPTGSNIPFFEDTDIVSVNNHEIARIKIYGETVGEDERLQDLLSNIGMSLQPADHFIFEDADIKESSPDWQLINRKRRELLLEASNIKPFIGTYKALINAIKYFGYENITLNEYWVNINEQSENFGKMKAIAVANQDTRGFLSAKGKSTELPNSNSKKTSRFSLVYRLNNFNGTYDTWDIPVVEEALDFSPDEVLIKLYGLKNKLQKDYIPLHAKIVDIVGEGDYFSQFNMNVWTNQQNIFDIDEGVDVSYTVFPEQNLYIEDLRKVSTHFTGKGQDFSSLHENIIDSAECINDILSFYSTYVDSDMSTFSESNIPIGCPIVLEIDSLIAPWNDLIFTWDSGDASTTIDNISSFGVYEIEWRIIGPHGYDRSFKGSLSDYSKIPITLPYHGTYDVELALYDLSNVRSVRFNRDSIRVMSKNVETYAITQSLSPVLNWNEYIGYNWLTVGSSWNLSSENDIHVRDFTGSYYLTMDRANYAKRSDDNWRHSTVIRYEDPLSTSGFAETPGPYSWKNMISHRWNGGKNMSWDMTRIGSDLFDSFVIEFNSIDASNAIVSSIIDNIQYSYTILSDVNGNSATDLQSWESLEAELNSINIDINPIFGSFSYNLIIEDTTDNGTADTPVKIIATGNEKTPKISSISITGSNYIISYQNKRTYYNPSFADAKIINQHDTYSMLHHFVFSYDISNIPGILNQTWTIKNNSKKVDDIYYIGRWLPYVFDKEGDYMVSLTLTDVNGNQMETTKNILTIV